MKKIALISIVALPALAAPGQQTLSTIDWNDPGRKPDPAYATVVTNSGRVCLKIERTEDKPATIPLLTIEKPAISNTLYAVLGLLAIVLLAVFPFLFNRLRKRYAEWELRRMISLDAQS
jgi:hypothetical protein